MAVGVLAVMGLMVVLLVAFPVVGLAALPVVGVLLLALVAWAGVVLVRAPRGLPERTASPNEPEDRGGR